MTIVLERDGKQTTRRTPATQMLADFTATARPGPQVRAQAARVLVDTVAVTIAGGAEPPVRRLESNLEGDGRGTFASFWTPARYRPEDSALLIGMASHMLDYDDVSMLTVCHPTAPILSALLAIAPADASGADILDALAVGTEVMIRLGQAMGFRHYALGFHATATLGAVGSAAACARLMKLDAGRTGHAISIAASHASGLCKNFGSMVKSLHVGIAASNGLRSAKLAAAGIEGAAEAIEADGFLQAFSGAETDAWPEGLVLGAPFAIADPGFEQKRYPCCYMLHKMIEGTLRLRREHGLSLDQVAAMRVDMAPGATKPLIHPFPKSGLNALFSAPYAVCAALEDGRVDLKSFTDEEVMRAGVQGRLRDVTVAESEAQAQGAKDIGSAPVTVTLTRRDGRTVTRTVVLSPGSLRDPLTDADLEAKWTDCLRRAQRDIDAGTARALLDEGLAIAAAPSLRPWLDGIRAAVLPS